MFNHNYKCKYFKPHELVDRHTYNVYSEAPETLYKLFPEGLLRCIDAIREIAYKASGKGVTINNWYYGGNRQWSGLRNDKWVHFNPRSMHAFARAFDMIFYGITVKEVYEEILKQKEYFFALGIKRIENPEVTVNWLHIDDKETWRDEIYTFNP